MFIFALTCKLRKLSCKLCGAILIVVALLLLSGCSGTTAIDAAANAGQAAIDAHTQAISTLDTSLTKECKTAGIQAQIDGLKKQAVSIQASQNAITAAGKQDIKAEQRKTAYWQLLAYCAFGIIGLFVFIKIRNKITWPI